MDAAHLPNLFASAVERACRTVPALAHVDASRIAVLAYKLPATWLGETIGLREAKRTRVFDPVFSRMTVDGREILYVVSLSARLLARGSVREHDALDTVMHELWHIAPECDGTIRPMRHGAAFNAQVRALRAAYLANGGEPLPTLDHDARVRVRHFDSRLRPGVLYVRRGAPVPARIERWKPVWDERDVRERTTSLFRLLPKMLRYVCPAGHVMTRHRKLARPSSCATCSPRFDKRFLLRPLA